MESLSNQRKKNEFYSHFFTTKSIRNFNKLKSVKSKNIVFISNIFSRYLQQSKHRWLKLEQDLL